MRLIAAGVTCNSAAALAKLSARAAASNARTPLRKGSLRMAPPSEKLILSCQPSIGVSDLLRSNPQPPKEPATIRKTDAEPSITQFAGAVAGIIENGGGPP